MFNDAIKQLIQKIEVLPEALVVMYLRKCFNLTENMARQAVFAACRDRVCFKKGDYIVRLPYLETNSTLQKKACAFRVAIEFLPESKDFTVGYNHWLVSFLRGKNLVQVCYIEQGMETVSSMMIAEKPIHESDRGIIKRIAIVEPKCDLQRIKNAGFSFFCTVDAEFSLKIVAKNEDMVEAWSDVPYITKSL